MITVLVWSLQRGENSLACVKNRTRLTVLQAVVTMQTELLRVQTHKKSRSLVHPIRLK